MEEEKCSKSLVPDQGNKTPINRHQESITSRASRIHKETSHGYWLERITTWVFLKALNSIFGWKQESWLYEVNFQGATGINIERALRQVSAQEHSCSISFINLVARCKMHMLTYRLVAGDFQKLEPNATHVRCYSYTAYPLKNGRSREKYFMGCTKR